MTHCRPYDTVIHSEEVLTIRAPKGTRRRLEQDELLASFAAARAELLPQARAQGIYTDEDVFAIVS